MYSLPSLSKRMVGTAGLTAVAVIGALALGLAPGAGASGATASAVPPCQTSGLDVWFDTEGNGAAGSIFYKLEFTNLSSHTCSLKGFPTAWAVNLNGQRLGSNATPQGGTPHTVKLAIGASATAQLRIVEALNFPPPDCHPVTAAGLRVRPPGQSASRLVPFPFEACAKTGHTNLGVGLVQE